MKPVLILGSGGHAKVLLGMLKRLDTPVLGIIDPQRSLHSDYLGIKVLGGDSTVLNYAAEQIELVNAVGSLPNDAGVRAALYEHFSDLAYIFKTVVDPAAHIAEDVQLADGVQVMAGAVIQSGTKIANNSIINSGAIIEHDCRIGRHVHIAPGAVLSGNVRVGERVHIGTAAAVIQGIEIGAGSIIGAGCVVTKAVGPRQIVYPARGLQRDL